MSNNPFIPHSDIFNLQQQIDNRLDRVSNTTEENEYWTDWRVIVCKWLDKSYNKGCKGLSVIDMMEYEDLISILNS